MAKTFSFIVIAGVLSNTLEYLQITMSTFKRSPAYAELIFKLFDANSNEKNLIAICSKCRWVFPGGTLGERQKAVELTHEELPTSGTAIPGGSILSWVPEMEEKARKGRTGYSVLPTEMADLMRQRSVTYHMPLRTRAGWISTGQALMEEVKDVVLGMPSVYELCYRILLESQNRDHRRVGKPGYLEGLSRELYLGGSCSADVSLEDMNLTHVIFHEILQKNAIPFLTSIIRRIEHVYASCLTCKVNDTDVDVMDEVEMGEGYVEDEYDWDFVRTMNIAGIRITLRPRCIFWKAGGHCWALGLTDLRKVSQYIIGIRNYAVGLAADASVGVVSRGTTLLNSLHSMMTEVTHIAELGRHLQVGEHLDLCKAYKAALAIVKANIAGEMSTQYLSELWSDIDELSIGRLVKPAMFKHVANCLRLPPSGSLPLAKIFRLMPPPDVWIVDALRERWEEASVIKNIGSERCEEFRTSLREVILTALMRNKRYKLRRKEGVEHPDWWADYMDRDYSRVPTADLYRVFEFDGIVEVAQRSRYDPKTWKDSGCGADSLEEGLSDDRPRHMKNFLLRMMYDPGCPMPENLCREHRIAEAGLKGESHKKRIFYSNCVSSRMHQSMTEETVGGVMTSHPSFAIQKTGVERDDAFEELASPPDVGAYQGRTGLYADLTALMFSFDIKGWSSGMASDIQRTSHEVWDQVTGTTNFTQTEANHHLARVYVNQDGMKVWYTNGSANFEGYNGKEMTALHIAIMSIAVQRLRDRLPDVDPQSLSIVLQAYIDDGLAKLVLPKENALSVFYVWCNVVVDTWAEFGFTIERKKSFPSPAYFEFLGEEYYAGTHLATGSKAAMRITADPFERYESLADRVVKLCSACRGSSVAGLPPPSAFLMQTYMVSLETLQWVSKVPSTALAAWLIAPRAAGGLGMPCLMQQATNASGASTEESYTNLYAWALNNEAVRKCYVTLVRRGFEERTSESVLSTPLGGQNDVPTVSLGPIGLRILRTMDNHLSYGKVSTLGAYMLSLRNRDVYSAFAKTILCLDRTGLYQEALLNDLAEPTPQRIHAAFIRRFETPRTISYFLRHKTLNNVRKANLREAKISAHKFKNLLGSKPSRPTQVGTVFRAHIRV